ncbi:Sap-like sulfolipid-1-addressing protein [Haloactinopolyspora alba]|uniref:Sap-like sulfolipid-1-addressing protein n=2 Tax=Haloactinopolyspora alba TaxID=648780 RepID=A0A2P8E069_9ACTN|nr:Sap-like sulfolipid-1-addressing protein [Haloactinopolyspora alba]
MGDAVGQVLPLAVGVTLSPLPVIVVVLMLGTRRARSNGLSFLLGWLVGLAAVGTAAILVAGGADASGDGEPAAWVSWVKLALGALVLLLAAKTWRGRARGDEPAPMPSWMSALDTFTAVKSAGLGVLLAAVNPKNLVLTLSAGVAVAQTGIPAGRQAAALAVFVVVGALGPGVPVVISLVLGERAARALNDLQTWMARHNSAIMTVVMLVIGAKLVGDGIAGAFG